MFSCVILVSFKTKTNSVMDFCSTISALLKLLVISLTGLFGGMAGAVFVVCLVITCRSAFSSALEQYFLEKRSVVQHMICIYIRGRKS